MKRSNLLGPRRFRLHSQPRWHWHLALLLAALAVCLGVLLLIAGVVSLLGQPGTPLPVGEPLHLLLSGGLLLCCGVLGWRSCRSRLRRRSDISLPRHLLKNRAEGSPPHKR